jgi:hypothetical protein
MRGFTILRVTISRQPVQWIVARCKLRLVSFTAIVCLLLLGLSSYDAIHVHRSVGPLENAPVAPHHCLLCLAASMPLGMHAIPAAPIAPIARPAALITDQVVAYESASTFPLCIRPPPQV